MLASGALYTAGGLPFLGRMAQAEGFAPLGQRVLVNIMLEGGPDLRHLFPPAYNSNPSSYGFRYWEARASSHAIAQSSSAYLTRWQNNYFPITSGATNFGILNSCGWLKRMWDAGNVAIVCNMVGATTRDHAHCQLVMDQGNRSSGPNDFNRSGWGGQLAYYSGGNVLALTRTPRRFCYGPDFSDPEDHDDANLIALRDTRNASLFKVQAAETGTSRAVLARSLAAYYEAQRRSMDPVSPYFRFLDMESKVRDFGEQLEARLASVSWPSGIWNLTLGNLNSLYLGKQIQNLYDSLAANDILALRVASLEYGSWDSHKDQASFIEPKLSDLFGDNKALDTLYTTLPAGTTDNLVMVLAGEFGRQLKANGGNGTDHGKGNIMLVIGDSVNGGIYGNMFPEEELARLDTPGADINGLTEFDHVFGAVCDWISPGSGNTVFPMRGSAAIEAGVNFAGLFS